MYFIGYGCAQIGPADNPAAFRIPWGIQMIPAILLFLLLPMFPRSPRWLAGQGRWDEAIETLAMINAKGNRDDPEVVAEIAEIREAVEQEKKDGSSYLVLLKRQNINRVFISLMTQVWQQLAGGNIMMYYVVYVFEMAGLKGNTNLIASGVQYAIMVVFQVPVFFYIDHVGRRPLLIFGSMFMGIFIFAVGGLIATQGHYVDSVNGNPNIHVSIVGNQQATNAILLCSYFFILVYAMTLAPVAWVYAPEVLGLNIRAKGMGISASGNWIFNFSLGFFVPSAFNNIGYQTFIIFGIFCMAQCVHFFLFFPETAQKSLEEIDDLFAKNGPKAWRTRVGHSRVDREAMQVDQQHHMGADMKSGSNQDESV